MKIRRWTTVVLMICVGILSLEACGKGKIPDGSKQYIYYVNAEGTGLVSEEYTLPEGTVQKQIEKMLKELRKETDSIDYNSAYPKNIEINKWELNDSDLVIDFKNSYNSLNVTEELLLRAATVQTLVQLGQVDYVYFTVEGKPLCNKSGREVGYMGQDTFVKNVGSSLHSYQDGNICLYFANKDGDKLVKEEINVRYNSNMSIEKLIVEQLIKGPSTDTAYPTISPETKLLGVSIRDGICYVNFDEEFLEMSYKVSPQVAIYSVVNSIIKGGEVSQVQILVNGEIDITYQESISLEKPFSRNLEIIKED